MKKYISQHLNLGTLLPLTAGLWLGYLLLLLAIDHLFFPRPVFPPLYYTLNALVALAVLGIAVWPRGRTWLGQALLPLVVTLLSVTPVVLAQVLMVGQPPPPGRPADRKRCFCGPCPCC